MPYFLALRYLLAHLSQNYRSIYIGIGSPKRVDFILVLLGETIFLSTR